MCYFFKAYILTIIQMTETKTEAQYENIWSFFLSIVFLALTIVALTLLYQKYPRFDLNDITFFEFLILGLATFRLTRLFVYDSIMRFFRDFFTAKTVKIDKRSKVCTVTRDKPLRCPQRKIYELLACPWCTGVWISLFTVAVYYLFPLTWPFFLLLAVAGLSTFIQLVANLTGWHAEGKKLDVQSRN